VGALLITTHQLRRVLNSYGFRDGENCLLYTDPAHLEEHVKWALDPENRERVDVMRTAGWQLIRDRHTVQQRAHYLHNLLVSLPMMTGS